MALSYVAHQAIAETIAEVRGLRSRLPHLADVVGSVEEGAARLLLIETCSEVFNGEMSAFAARANEGAKDVYEAMAALLEHANITLASIRDCLWDPARNAFESLATDLEWNTFKSKCIEAVNRSRNDLPAADAHWPAASESGAQVTKREHSQKSKDRDSFVKPLLAAKGWSLLEWATESGVDFHTVNDYVKGKTAPYNSTRKKLAEALGCAPTDLPH